MSIIEPVIRPPAETNSFLLQVTLGCSADSCSFCGAYKGKFVPIFEELDAAFPRLTRISSYANGCNVTRKNNNELAELYKHKLSLIYMGLESGNQGVLDRCGKSSSVEEMIETVNKVAKVHIKSSV